MDDYLVVLKGEFDAEDGSFLIQLRCDLEWSKDDFQRLVNAMQKYLERHPATESIERWIASGFWYLDHFAKDWTSHPDFPRRHEQDYYERAYERLHELADWLFTGESPYKSGTLDPFV